MADIAKEDAATAPRTTYLADYRPPAYRAETLDLRFELDPADTLVRARTVFVREAHAATGAPLELDGHELELLELRLDGAPVPDASVTRSAAGLRIEGLPERFELEVLTRIHPERNTALEGLYVSGGMFCTQCEAEGFRRITYFPDRPDVMARYTTTIVAERARYPVLLSNGNPIARGADGDRHWVTWEDPFPKPSYLFALVAGDLVCHEDRFTTRSGRDVALRIYVEPENRHKTAHAMESLKQAMRWDEEVYGREYDLDIFMVVAVNDFNMGAMENKGLNIFNASCVLASPDTATDEDYQSILGIVGHEYFHNWSGNRVTCRDWFQLSLKEGLTVFRDQEFTADMLSRPVKRIHDVNLLRSHQFPQDAGPMAHPVRPAAYMEISNFYTVTVYNKGAEVVRMLRNLVGAEGFRRGTDLYFERHDGQAVTTDDFLAAIADASGQDLEQFKLWYDQAGTPELQVDEVWDAERQVYELRIRQHLPATPGQPDKRPMLIPLAVALLDGKGRALPLQLEGEPEPGPSERVLAVREAVHRFRFVNLPERPRPSLLRGFSAPVKLVWSRTPETLAFQLSHDSDGFNRWEAGQQLALQILLAGVAAQGGGTVPPVPDLFVDACARTLAADDLDPAVKAQILTLPVEAYVAEQCEQVDPGAIHAAREQLRVALGQRLWGAWERAHGENHADGYRFTAEDVGRRRLRNLALSYMVAADPEQTRATCLRQYREADNMTDRLAALSLLASQPGPEREASLAEFHETWHHDAQALEKWFAVQARAELPDALARVRALLEHPAFSLTNPNKVRAVIGAFAQGNPAHFHAPDGSGYAFLAEQILALDRLNPQMAARFAQLFSRWRRYEPVRRERMLAELRRLAGSEGLSRDLYEIVAKSLA